MFEHVIVGVDGAEGGRDAIALARILGAPDRELTLACVYHREPLPRRAVSGADEAAEWARARDVLVTARDEAGIEARLRRHGSASVGRGLHELAEALGADLLVVGSSRRGLVGRVLVGDDTRAALNGAPCAVAIAPTAYAHRPTLMREIGVGYDGSPESAHALGAARTLAAEQDCKLSAFQAVGLPANMYGGPTWPDETSIEDMVDRARERIAELGDVEAHAAFGQAAEELSLYSASLDLLVVGSRSYGPIGRLMHGSTAQQLARTARCPLLVLTRAARKAQATGASTDAAQAPVANATT